jgi:hypothetical protein
MSRRNLKKYLLIYELEIKAKNMKEAVETGDREETRMGVRLKKIEGKDESWERFYDVDPSVLGSSSFKAERR